MSFLHDALCLSWIDSRKVRVQFCGETISALVIFVKSDKGPDLRIAQWCAEFLSRVQNGTVITSGIGAGEKHFRVGTAFLGALFKRIAEGGIQ